MLALRPVKCVSSIRQPLKSTDILLLDGISPVPVLSSCWMETIRERQPVIGCYLCICVWETGRDSPFFSISACIKTK